METMGNAETKKPRWTDEEIRDFERTIECRAVTASRMVSEVPMYLHLIELPADKEKPSIIVVHAGISFEDGVESFMDFTIKAMPFDQAIQEAVKQCKEEVDRQREEAKMKREFMKNILGELMPPVDPASAS